MELRDLQPDVVESMRWTSHYNSQSSVKSAGLMGSPDPASHKERVGRGKVLRQSTLHQLKVFQTTARHCSFTRAAEELFLTQPTISMQIRQLTQAIGMPLFEQIGKRLYLTDAGKELLVACNEIFERLAQLESKVSNLKGMQAGQLRLAAISPINYFATRLLGLFCQLYPGIDVSLEVVNHEHLLDRLWNNLDDLYFMSQPPRDLPVHCQPFIENPLVIVAPSNHPLAQVKQIPITQLNGEQFIMREPGSATREAVEQRFKEHEVAVRVQLEMGNSEMIKQSVMCGLGISVLSAHMIASEVAKGQLVILDVAGFPIRRDWYVVYPTGKNLSIVTSTFFQFLEENAQGLMEAAD